MGLCGVVVRNRSVTACAAMQQGGYHSNQNVLMFEAWFCGLVKGRSSLHLRRLCVKRRGARTPGPGRARQGAFRGMQNCMCAAMWRHIVDGQRWSVLRPTIEHLQGCVAQLRDVGRRLGGMVRLRVQGRRDQARSSVLARQRATPPGATTKGISVLRRSLRRSKS